MRNLFENIEKIYLKGFRQKTEKDCGPASVVLVAMAFGLRRVTYKTLLSYKKYGRWLNRQAGRARGMNFTELHFATEATLGKDFEVTMTRAFPENFKKFVADLRSAKGSRADGPCALVLNFNQDYLLGIPYKNDEEAVTHYSPVMGFDGKKVTIADVDPDVPRPYSVPIKKTFYSMSEPHHIFEIPRGWITVRRRKSWKM